MATSFAQSSDAMCVNKCIKGASRRERERSQGQCDGRHGRRGRQPSFFGTNPICDVRAGRPKGDRKIDRWHGRGRGASKKGCNLSGSNRPRGGNDIRSTNVTRSCTGLKIQGSSDIFFFSCFAQHKKKRVNSTILQEIWTSQMRQLQQKF